MDDLLVMLAEQDIEMNRMRETAKAAGVNLDSEGEIGNADII